MKQLLCLCSEPSILLFQGCMPFTAAAFVESKLRYGILELPQHCEVHTLLRLMLLCLLNGPEVQVIVLCSQSFRVLCQDCHLHSAALVHQQMLQLLHPGDIAANLENVAFCTAANLVSEMIKMLYARAGLLLQRQVAIGGMD